MAKLPELHNYSSLESFDRLLFLIAVIAQNPGIASSNEASNKGIDPMQVLIAAMQELANQQGIEMPTWSVAALRKDVAVLKQYGILPVDVARRGYFLGGRERYTDPFVEHKKVPRTKTRKATMSVEQIKQLRADGLTLQAVAKQAGLSRERVRQICLR